MPVNTYTFRRIEKKYLLNRETFNAFFSGIRNRIVGDEYGKSTICSAYLDTPDYRLIRTSLDAEDYKEKLRLRSYGKAAECSLKSKRNAAASFTNGVFLRNTLRLSTILQTE